MIKNAAELKACRDSWNGVRAIRDKGRTGVLGSFAQGGAAVKLIADIAHNLPFLHGFYPDKADISKKPDNGRKECHDKTQKVFS